MTAEEMTGYRDDVAVSVADFTGVNPRSVMFGWEDIIYVLQDSLQALPPHPRMTVTYYTPDTNWQRPGTFEKVLASGETDGGQ